LPWETEDDGRIGLAEQGVAEPDEPRDVEPVVGECVIVSSVCLQ